MSVSERIKQERKAKKLSQNEFADLIQSSQPTIYNIEKGAADTGRVTVKLAKKICNVLDISFTELFEIEDSESENEKLKTKINDLNESIKGNDIIISQLVNRVADKELIIDLLQKEKITYKKDILHFLEETYDTQTYFLDKYSSLSAFHKKEIQNSILSLMNTLATSHFVTTGLISECDLEKIIPKHKGIVRPVDPEEKE